LAQICHTAEFKRSTSVWYNLHFLNPEHSIGNGEADSSILSGKNLTFERRFRLNAGDAFSIGAQRGPTASASPLATLLSISLSASIAAVSCGLRGLLDGNAPNRIICTPDGPKIKASFGFH
jgi:hypothetical protein